jgi:DNA-binding MarR family transcriptional regulator
MSPLAELITAWEAFLATNPKNVTVEAFCDYFQLNLQHDYMGDDDDDIIDDESGTFHLARSVGRLAAIQRTCTRLALKDIPDIEPEWYYFLHSINEKEEVRKTEVISINLLLEPTTGLDILNRMIKAGLLLEEQDIYDKRSRLLRLTPKGQSTLKKAEQQVRLVTDLLFNPNLDTIWRMIDDYLDTPVRKFGRLLTEHRPKTMEELLALVNNRT